MKDNTNDNRTPKLRTVNKVEAPYPLNEFPKKFPILLGKELVYLLASKAKPDLEGAEWERIFATCIGADWKPSNIGLDDVALGSTAWGAKTVKASNLSNLKNVRLISGRNSPVYSFGDKIDTSADPNLLGTAVLQIWNERVSSVRERFKNLRTVVLVKSQDLLNLCVFEFETIRYDPELFRWEWNQNKNLIGKDKKNNEHKFTWQPHGSQFTIVEQVPNTALKIQIKQPPQLDKESVLKEIGFSEDWITIIKNDLA